MSIGLMMAGTEAESSRPVTQRVKDDYYPTDPLITRAMLAQESEYLPRDERIWEPACGEGHIAKVLGDFGYRVIGTDLVDRGYGRGGMDFLKTKRALSRRIFTNPPYQDGLPELFIRHAFTIGCDYVAVLLKAQFFHTQGRVALWRDITPAREYKVCWRPDFLGLGGGTMDFTWWVFDRRAKEKMCRTYLLEKPT